MSRDLDYPVCRNFTKAFAESNSQGLGTTYSEGTENISGKVDSSEGSDCSESIDRVYSIASIYSIDKSDSITCLWVN